VASEGHALFKVPETPLPIRCSALRLLCLGAIALAGTLGCVDRDDGAGLYLFDNASRTVQVWQDLEQLHSAARSGGEIPKPVRAIKSSLFRGLSLAWGGMALDGFRHRLYLVSEDGKVHVILNPANRDGELSRPSDIISFSLGASGDRLRGGSVFGQAALDPGKDILYVVENARDGDETRLWQVANASKVANHATVARDEHSILKAEGDRQGAGVAAGPFHRVYALFGGGEVYEDDRGAQSLRGPRLRQGTAGAFPASLQHRRPMHTLMGPGTRLPDPLGHGSLAYDGRQHELYVLVPPGDAGRTAILVFGDGQFNGRHDQAPARTLPDPPRDLRILARPWDGNWMLGAAGTASGGRGALYLWKAPHEGGGHVEVPNLPGVTDIRGMAAAS